MLASQEPNKQKKSISCLDQHSKCNAECCRQFSIKVPELRMKPVRGQLMRLKHDGNISPDMQWYYNLHGMSVTELHAVVILDRFEFDRKKSAITIFKDCLFLKDNKCAGHPDNKPEICIALNDETAKCHKFNITPNCRFHE